MIALSFDDGPSEHTPRLLDLLEKHNARATFFTVGSRLDAYRDTATRAVSMECEVAGHSWVHKRLSELTEDEPIKYLSDPRTAIRELSGFETVIYRPPYGSFNDTVQDVSRRLGLAIINWSIDPRDWEVLDADSVYNTVIDNAEDKAIVLSHDLYGTTVEAYSRIIPELIARGYRLVTVSELLSHTPDFPEAGKVYCNG